MKFPQIFAESLRECQLPDDIESVVLKPSTKVQDAVISGFVDDSVLQLLDESQLVVRALLEVKMICWKIFRQFATSSVIISRQEVQLVLPGPRLKHLPHSGAVSMVYFEWSTCSFTYLQSVNKNPSK